MSPMILNRIQSWLQFVLVNSEYMRNGDYQSTRFCALVDTVITVFQTKVDSNPENTVGVMTSQGNKRCAHPRCPSLYHPYHLIQSIPVLTD